MNQPLSNSQIELLKTFSREVTEQDALETKRMITYYFAQKAIAGANQVWDQQGWDEKKAEELLNSHLRTPYPFEKVLKKHDRP